MEGRFISRFLSQRQNLDGERLYFTEIHSYF
jgi:hypothetical protein